MKISDQLLAVFTAAQTREAELYDVWIRISHRVGARLPNSLLSASIQRDGALDALLRCMEREQAELMASRQSGSFAFHYQKLMSELWIGCMYETFRLLRDRKLSDLSPEFGRIFSDLELIRIVVDKHELPKDRKLEGPLEMARRPASGDSSDIYIYDPKDDKRAHIMPVGVSQRGSVMWHVIDVRSETARWVERLGLSERIISLWTEMATEAE